jgi:hypothetical protein
MSTASLPNYDHICPQMSSSKRIIYSVPKMSDGSFRANIYQFPLSLFIRKFYCNRYWFLRLKICLKSILMLIFDSSQKYRLVLSKTNFAVSFFPLIKKFFFFKIEIIIINTMAITIAWRDYCPNSPAYQKFCWGNKVYDYC